MSVDNYLEVLQDLQREYRRINNKITISTAEDPYTADLAKLHADASEECRKITALLGDKEESYELRRWERRRAEHLEKSQRILKKLRNREDEHIAAAGKYSESGENVENEITDGLFHEIPKHSFADVVGMEDLKVKLKKHVRNADKKGLFELLKIDRVTGFLFYGPPGCGKTYLIEAFVHELMKDGYRYMYVEGGEILDKFQGDSEKKVKEIFRTAEEIKEPCILFIDEVDSLCLDRNTPEIPVHRVSLTNSFLTAFNHLKDSDKEVFFMAATNHPEKIDLAMCSRMRMERFPIPEPEAIRHYLEYKFNDVSIRLDDKDDLSWEEIAQDFQDHSYRDIDQLIDIIKREVVGITDDRELNDKESMDAVVSGEISLTRDIYERCMDDVIFAPIEDYMEILNAWEAKMNIGRKRKKKGQADGTDKGTKGNVGTAKAHVRKALFEDKSSSQKALKENDNHFRSIPRNGNMFNSNPFMDIQAAFIFNECICPATVSHQESGERYLEHLDKMKAEAESAGAGAIGVLKQIEKEICGVRNALFYPADELHTRFRGMDDTAFDVAYDSFFTLMQGNSVPGFSGTCGIIASCNMVNQQTGSRLTEADGVAAFTAADICTEEGGTSTENRESFIRSKNLKFESFQKDFIDDAPELPEQDLEKLARRFCEGESIMLAVMASDLSQDEIVSREVDPEFQLEILLRLATDPDSVSLEERIAAFYPGLSNHMVSVAGFSYAEDGSVAGLWLNDTGGWAQLLTNRIYLSAEKYNLMKEATRGFSVEFVKNK